MAPQNEKHWLGGSTGTAHPRAGRVRIGGRERGQSLVELAIILPALLLIVLAALDLGRVFMGWVVLNNAARVGANYAALHSDAWGTPGDSVDQTTYVNLVTQARNDASAAMTGCDTAAIPDPGFPGGTSVGDPAEVVLDCEFTPITPIIGDVFAGGSFTVTARSVFPIRTGLMAGAAVTPPPSCLSSIDGPTQGFVDEPVTFTDQTPPAASGWIWDFGDTTPDSLNANPQHTYTAPGDYTVTLNSRSNNVQCNPDTHAIQIVELPSPDPSAGASPPPLPSAPPTAPPCQVPHFAPDVRKNAAQDLWEDHDFTTLVQIAANAASGNWRIQYQSLVGGLPQPCNVTIIISDKPIP